MSTMGIDQLIRIWFHVDLSTVIEQNRMPLMFLSYFTKTNRARIVPVCTINVCTKVPRDFKGRFTLSVSNVFAMSLVISLQ